MNVLQGSAPHIIKMDNKIRNLETRKVVKLLKGKFVKNLNPSTIT